MIKLSEKKRVLDGSINFESTETRVGQPIIAEILLHNNSEDNIIIEAISGFKRPKFRARLLQEATKVLLSQESWTYFIEIIPLKSGEFTLHPQVYYTYRDRKEILPLGSYKILVKDSADISFEDPKISLKVVPSEIICNPGEKFSLSIIMQNYSLKDKYFIKRIKSIVPSNFQILSVKPTGVVISDSICFSNQILKPEEKLEIRVDIRAPIDILYGEPERLYETVPQLIVAETKNDVDRVINAEKLIIKLKIPSEEAATIKENDTVIIKIPQKIAKIIKTEELNRVKIFPYKNILLITPLTEHLIHDPMKKLIFKALELEREKTYFVYAAVEGRISKDEYRKRVSIIDKQINNIRRQMETVKKTIQDFTVPEIALHFSDRMELDTESLFEREELQLFSEKKELLLNLVNLFIEEEKRLKNLLKSISKAVKGKIIDKRKAEKHKELILSKLYEIEDLKQQLKSLLEKI